MYLDPKLIVVQVVVIGCVILLERYRWSFRFLSLSPALVRPIDLYVIRYLQIDIFF